jgi:hypothetical protein
MEDTHLGVFRSDPTQQVMYKRILEREDATELLRELEASAHPERADGGLATGCRDVVRTALRELPTLAERLRVAMSDYLPDASFGEWVRLYRHTCGGVKPHRDLPMDGRSNYTLLIYMADGHTGGKLSVKVARSPTDLAEDGEPDKRHKVYEIQPRAGYGVLFRKSLLHWADDVIEGCKVILLVDVHSIF